MMFKVDLHVHTVLGGDSSIEPEELAARSREVGLDAVCVTEHNSYSLSAPFKAISRRAGFPIFRGMEYNAAEGHLLIYGVKAGKGDLPPKFPMQKAVDWVHERGGIAIPAHPFQKDILGRRPGERVLDLKGLMALEVMNGSASFEENRMAAEAAERLGINGIGGSDAHGLLVLGRAYTQFPDAVRTEEELVHALRKGEYAASWNEDYYGADRRDCL
ncbi:MAG: PHP domain-containing protein [Deltaproteobacteria bacterium]|nr:PHP domain-containing protein [Deltaproteobacteria bacterium]